MDRERGQNKGRDRGKSSLGKRPLEDRGDKRSGASDVPGQLHFRMLVAVKKAGSVIGKGGDFIQITKSMTGAKVAVDKAVGNSDERLVHVQGVDEPEKTLPGIQDAMLRTAERILGEETSSGTIKLPHKCQLRMLLYKYQIGVIMGRKGAAINEIRNKSSASVKLLSPSGGEPILPCAERDDELITIAGTPEQTLTALKMITDKLRTVPSFGDRDRGHDHADRDRDAAMDKRSRGSHDRDRDGSGYGDRGRGWDAPPHGMHGEQGAPHGGPHGNAISMALPIEARGILDNNDSVKTDGLTGLATVEYRMLVPGKRSGAILGNKGGVIKDIRGRYGARVMLFDEEKNCTDRILQVMSTEDVQDQHCAAFDAAMDCIQTLLHDELASEHVGMIRFILPHGQVGAVMGKGGNTINNLRGRTGASLQLLSKYPDVPRCVTKGEEVLEIRGTLGQVLLACHVVLVAIRGNMSRGQLMFKYPVPLGAPPPTPRAPPPHLTPGGHGGPVPGLPQAPDSPGMNRSSRGSRWDSDVPRGGGGGSGDPRLAHGMPGPPAAGPPLQGPPPAGSGPLPGPQPGVVYAPPPDGAGVPHPQPQVQYVQGPPPQALPAQPGLPQPQVQYVQAPPVQQPPPQQQQPGLPPPPHQVVVYTSQPPPGSNYVPQQQVVLQQPPHHQVAVQGPPGQQVVEYVGGAPPTYVQGVPPSQQQPGATSQPMVVYTSAPGQLPQYIDPNTQQPVAVAQPQPQVMTSTGMAVMQGQPQQVTYIYAPAPGATAPVAAPASGAGVPAPAAVAPSSSGPASTSGYGGLAGLVATAQAVQPAAAAPAAPPAPAPAPAVVAPPAPKARVLLTQDQVVRLRLDDANQLQQLSALSGAAISLSDHILDNGAREVLLAGSDAQCNTATNLMEALMKSN